MATQLAIATTGAVALIAYATRDDRDLQFALKSDAECLVFDRLTSDLFVAPQIGHRVLEALQRGGPMDAKMLLDELATENDPIDAGSLGVIELLLGEFESCGLIERFCVDCCGSDAP